MAEVLDIQPLDQLDIQPLSDGAPGVASVSTTQTLDIQPLNDESRPALDITPLPTVSAKTTGYWPANTPMEGGPLDRMGAPLHTIEAYRRGEVPWVGLAGDPSIPYGTPAASPAYPDVPFRIVDTGDRFKGVGLTHFDIAHENEAGANSTESNQSAVPFQVDINPDMAGKLPTNIPGDPLSDKGKTSALLAFGLGAARAIPGVAAGAGLAGSLEGPNIAISAFTGPAAPVTMAGLNILEFLGGMLIGNRVSKEGEKALAPHSELIRNAQAAAADHPLAEMVGEQVPMAPFVLRSAKGFYDVAKSADTASAAAKSIAKGLTGGAAGGAATEAARPHVEQALNFAGQQLGLTPEQIQEPTVRSYLENAAIGAALAGEAARQGAGDKGIGDVKVPERPPEAPITNSVETGSKPVIESQPRESQPSAPSAASPMPATTSEPAAPAHLPDIPDSEILAALQRTMANRAAAQPPTESVVAGIGDAGEGAPTITEPVNPFDTSATSQQLTDLQNTRPRPIDKLFGKTGGTPEQRAAHEDKIRKWNSDYRKAQKAHREAVEKSNNWIADAQKLKLRADRNEAGFLNADLLQGAADLGRRIYRRGMDFTQWAAEMVRALGRKIRPHLAALWNSITGQNILPSARESGAVGRGDISQEGIEGASNKPDKQREHIKTIQRMTEVSPTVKEQVESWYSPSSIPEVNARAQARIDEQSLDAVLLGLMKRELTSNDDLALAHAAALRLDGMGRIDDAITVREKMAESLTGPAQMLQYISTISKTSPEGLVREAQKTVTNFIAQDPEKQKLLADIQRLQQQLAAATAGQTPEAVKATINLTLRDLAKVNKPGQRLTPERLNDLIKRNDAGTLTADELARALMRHLNIPQVTPENISRIKAAQKLYAQAEANGDSIMRLRRGMEMMDQVYGLVPRSFWDKVRATATISMILHGKLPFRIGFSNAVRLIGQTMVDTIENVPRDLGNVFTGKRTITVDQLAGIGRGLAEPYFTFRSGYEDAKLRGLTTGRSFAEGTKTLIDIASMTTRGIMDLTDIRGRNSHTFSSRFGQMAENVVTLIHNIVPYAFWNAGYRSSLARQMRVAGVETPTAEMIGLARVDANKAIFQNDTVAYRLLFGVRKILDADINFLSRGQVRNFTKMQAKYGLGTATIPFARVPAALLTEGANWTPLGFFRAIGETARPLFGHDFRPKEIADNVIKAAIGTGSAFFAGMWLARLGVLSGPMDDDKAMKAMMQSLGWGAYKLNLSELKRRMASGDWTSVSTIPQPGDLIVNYNWAEPLAFPVAMGARITEAQNADERAGLRGRLISGETLTSVGAGAEALLDNPMLQSVQQLSTNLGEGNYGKLFTDIVGNVPGNFIPSLVRQTAQYMDNTVREARGGSMVDGEVARIVQQIPGLSQRFPARYDVFGEAVKRQNYGQVSLINTFFNPAQVSRFKANPEVSELMRLWIATGSSAGAPRGVDKSLTITKVNGQKQQIQLDNQQLATYQRYVGRLSAAMVTRLMASPAYAAAPDVVRQNTLTQVLEAVQRSAKIDLFGDRPFRVNMGSLTSKPSVSLPSFMDIGALAGGRKQGLAQPVPVGN